jgi:hypothetical protein
VSFEPLQTDEKLDRPVKPGPTFDTQMLIGCGSFVVTSFFTYALAVWPWLAFPLTHQVATLAWAIGLGLVPACVMGAVATRRAGLAGACGFLGGIMASAVFVHLRVDQHMLGRVVRDLPLPEYPTNWKYLLPAAYVLFAGIVIAFALPRGEIGDEPEAPKRRQ